MARLFIGGHFRAAEPLEPVIETAGASRIQRPGVDKVAFTGSTAAQTLKSIYHVGPSN